MAYTRTNWENNVTPLDADNMNNIEEGIGEAMTKGNTAYDRIHISQAEPASSDGDDGDVWFVYTTEV